MQIKMIRKNNFKKAKKEYFRKPWFPVLFLRKLEDLIDDSISHLKQFLFYYCEKRAS